MLETQGYKARVASRRALPRAGVGVLDDCRRRGSPLQWIVERWRAAVSTVGLRYAAADGQPLKLKGRRDDPAISLKP